MERLDWIKILINLFVGFLTLILQTFIPIGGGGISLIFVISIPATIGLSLISSMIFIWLASKNKPKDYIILIAVILNLFITFSMYPYA